MEDPAAPVVRTPETSLLPEKKHEEATLDTEAGEEKLKYPRSVFFIISNEFCERFSYYGMRTILVIYLTKILSYSDNEATVLYHTFTMFCYFFPLLGAVVADSWLGKFRTIFYLSIVYAIGNIVVSFASATGAIDIPARELTILGLLLIALGTGGIKPCVSAFGGDQFLLPQQERQLQTFFSLFYFSINSGSLISTFLTPILRQDVKCLDQDSCYPLAFGVPALLMVVSLVIFVVGKPFYTIKKPQGNIIVDVSKCICHAVAVKVKGKGQKRDHWLDHADDRYPQKLIEDIKATLRVLLLFVPLPFFWALFDQQGSRWTIQATQMNGALGGWAIKPDQMQVLNPLLVLALIPLFETAIYPLFARCRLLHRPLQRMVVGGVLAAVAFAISAVVELQLESTYAVTPGQGQAQVRIHNGLSCGADISSAVPELNFALGSLEMRQVDLSVSGAHEYTVRLQNNSCGLVWGNFNLTAVERQAKSYFVALHDTNNAVLYHVNGFDELDKTESGNPKLRVLYSFPGATANKSLSLKTDNEVKMTIELIESDYSSDYTTVDAAEYSVEIDGVDVGLQKINLQWGGVYTYLIRGNDSDPYTGQLFTITNPNTVHMLWLVPQYVIMSMGEVMFSITGLEFAFTQAPVSMKSVLQSGWLLTVAIGNLIVIIIAEAKFFSRQMFEFVLFACLMAVDMAIFALMCMRYKYVVQRDDESCSEDAASVELPMGTKPPRQNGIDNKTFKDDDER
ncbi:peptide transporter family 1 isoform X2 [Bacillus rossius redtenbacheri]|uniref:peptide transporter family 1 isoform X2 n=1 Tax=Bacillus rossius redtenbacheri TaxID=93214 RepID=UPI002FDDCE43